MSDACDNGRIGAYAKLVDARNQVAHSSGHIFFSTQAVLDTKITEMLRAVEEIQTHSVPVVEHCYREFLLHNHDAEDREYADGDDQVREVLIHGNYLSQRDIDICVDFDLGSLAHEAGFHDIRVLHDALVSGYKSEDEALVI